MATITIAARNLLLDGLDAAWNGGTVELRSGAKPGAASDINAGTVLGSATLPADLLAAAANGGKAGTATVAIPISASGTIGHVRIRQAGDPGTSTATGTQARLDATAGASGSGAEAVFDALAVVAGGTVNLTIALSIGAGS